MVVSHSNIDYLVSLLAITTSANPVYFQREISEIDILAICVAGLIRHKEPYWAATEDDRIAAAAAAFVGAETAACTYCDDWYAENEMIARAERRRAVANGIFARRYRHRRGPFDKNRNARSQDKAAESIRAY